MKPTKSKRKRIRRRLLVAKANSSNVQYIFAILVGGKEVFEVLLPNLGRPVHQVRAMAFEMAKNGIANTPELIRQTVKSSLTFGVLYQASGKRFVIYGYEGMITEKQLAQNQQMEYKMYATKWGIAANKKIMVDGMTYQILDNDAIKLKV